MRLLHLPHTLARFIMRLLHLPHTLARFIVRVLHLPHTLARFIGLISMRFVDPFNLKMVIAFLCLNVASDFISSACCCTISTICQIASIHHVRTAPAPRDINQVYRAYQARASRSDAFNLASIKQIILSFTLYYKISFSLVIIGCLLSHSYPICRSQA